jgi:tRNA-guanine family transglycosylase
MQLDDVIATTSPDHARIKEAMDRSVRWLDRCIEEHKYPERQNLFCIIQGGLDLELRKQCCEEMVARDTPGIAIGGLSGGEAKEEFCKVYVSSCSHNHAETDKNKAWIHAPDFCQRISLDTSWEWYVLPISAAYIC